MITKQASVLITAAGESVDAYTLVAGAMRVRILTLGGIVTHLFVPARSGTSGDVVLGFDDETHYLKNIPYFGAIIGRYGNRIAKGRFTLDGVARQLANNNGPSHLHGGDVGYDKRVWGAKAIDDAAAPKLTLSLTDADGMERYPGTVEVTVTYTLSDGVLRIDYDAVTTRATPLNLTNHTYFNLRDAGASSVLEHDLTLDADQYLAVDADLIPAGEPTSVEGTAIDFRIAKPIGRDLMAMGGDPAGYDHNLVLRADVAGPTLRRAAMVFEPVSGRSMECWTTEPAVQFYSGNFLNEKIIGKGGVPNGKHHGFCLETQHYPDSPNRPSFPNTTLRPGERFRSVTEYRFGVR